jgi:hypothetical protein
MNLIGQIIQTKPEYLLMVVTILVTGLVALVAQLRRAPREGERKLLSEVLNNPAVQARIKDSNVDASTLVEHILHKVYESDVTKEKGTRSNIFQKMVNDITWDVSGFIGIMVTVVLLFAIVSRTFDSIPKEILAGWTTILGLYFGKSGK